MALTNNGAPQIDHAALINKALGNSGSTSRNAKPASINHAELVSRSLGTYSKNQKKAAELTRLQGKAKEQGFFDTVKEGLGTSLSAVGKVLSIIDLPRSAIAATIRQGYGQLSDVIQGEDEYKVGQWWNDFVNHVGVGTMLEDSPLADSNIWLKRGIGFAGDVLTDPLTYVSLGAVPVAKSAGLKGIEVGAEALGRTAAEQTVKVGAEQIGKTAGEAVIEQTAKQASKEPLREGNRVLNRMLSREDVALRIEKSYEAGALSREAASKLQDDVFARGAAAIPRDAQAALVHVSATTGQIESAAIKSGVTWGFGSRRVMIPGTEAIAKRGGAIGGVVRQKLSEGIRWMPLLKHIPEKFESLPGLNKAFENFGRYAEEGFNHRGAWVLKHSETVARDVAHSASLGWANELKALHSKWATGFSETDNLLLRDAMEGLGSSQPKIRAAADDLAKWFEDVRVAASDAAGQEIPRFYDYLPHRLSKAYREYLSAGGKGASRSNLALELKRSYRAGEQFLGIPLENGSIKELESIARATFGKEYVQVFKSDPWEIATGYINEAMGYTHRGVFGKNLVKMGLATEADMADLGSRVLTQSRLRDASLRRAAEGAASKIRADDLEKELAGRATAGQLSEEAFQFAKEGGTARASADAAGGNARSLETVAKTLRNQKQKVGKSVTGGMRDMSPRGVRGPKISQPGGLSVARAERGVETAQTKLDALLAKNADEVAAAEAAAAQVDNAAVDAGAQVDNAAASATPTAPDAAPVAQSNVDWTSPTHNVGGVEVPNLLVKDQQLLSNLEQVVASNPTFVDELVTAVKRTRAGRDRYGDIADSKSIVEDMLGAIRQEISDVVDYTPPPGTVLSKFTDAELAAAQRRILSESYFSSAGKSQAAVDEIDRLFTRLTSGAATQNDWEDAALYLLDYRRNGSSVTHYSRNIRSAIDGGEYVSKEILDKVPKSGKWEDYRKAFNATNDPALRREIIREAFRTHPGIEAYALQEFPSIRTYKPKFEIFVDGKWKRAGSPTGGGSSDTVQFSIPFEGKQGSYSVSFFDMRPAGKEKIAKWESLIKAGDEATGSVAAVDTAVADHAAQVTKVEGYLGRAKTNLAKAQADLDSAEAKAAARTAAPDAAPATAAAAGDGAAALEDFAAWSQQVKGPVGTAAKKTARAIELDAAQRAGTPIAHELLDDTAASARKINKFIEKEAASSTRTGLSGYGEIEGTKWFTNTYLLIAEDALPKGAKFAIPASDSFPDAASLISKASEAAEVVVRLEQFADSAGGVLVKAIGENGMEVAFDPKYLNAFTNGLEMRLTSPNTPAGFFKDGKIVGLLMPMRNSITEDTMTASDRLLNFLKEKALNSAAGRRAIAENQIPQSVIDLKPKDLNAYKPRAQQIAEQAAKSSTPKFDEAAQKAEIARLKSLRDSQASEVNGLQSELDTLKANKPVEVPKSVDPEVKVEIEAAARSQARESIAASQIKAAERDAARAAGRSERSARQIERATARLEKAAAHLEKEQDRFNVANAARGEAEYAQAVNEARLLRIERDLENFQGAARATRVYQKEQAQLAKDLFAQSRSLGRDAAQVTRLHALHAAANARYDTGMADAIRFWGQAERVITPKEIETWQTVLEQGLKEFASDRWADPEVVDAIQAIQRVMKPETVNALVKSYDVLLARWKAYQLFTPGYHIRNFFGGQFNSALQGMRFRANFRYMKAMAEMRKNPDLGIDAISDAEFREAYREAVKHEIVVGNTEIRDLGDIYNGPNETDKGLFRDLMKSKKRKAFEQAQRDGRYVEKTAAGMKPGKNFDPTAMDNLLLEWNHRMAARVEHAIRVPQFVDHFIATGNLEESLNMVRKFQFDYAGATADSLSQAERKYARRLFPFYTYTRFNFPLQLEMMWRQPGKYALYNSAKRNIELGVEKEDVVPSFYGKLLAIHTPFTTNDSGPYFTKGEQGANVYLTPDLPFRDLAETLNPSTLFGQLTPLIKTPIELAAGKSIYTDIPFRSGNSGYTPIPQTWMPLVPFLASPLGGKFGLPKVMQAKDGTWLINDRDAYKIEQSLPILARLRRLAPSEPKFQKRAFTTYLSLIGGVSSYTNSSSSQWGELERQAKVIRDEIKMREVVNTEY